MPDTGQYRLEDLKQRWRRDPSSRLFLQLADEHRKLGQHAEAVAVLEQGLENRPHDLSALVALGRCRLELDQAHEAIGPLEEVISRDPTHIVANKLLVEAHLQQGDAEKAGQRLETYRLLNDRDPELDHLAYRLERLRSESGEEAITAVGGVAEDTTEDETPFEIEAENEAPAEIEAEDEAPFEIEAEDEAPFEIEAEDEAPFEIEAEDEAPFEIEAEDEAPFEIEAEDEAPAEIETQDDSKAGAETEERSDLGGTEPDPSKVPPVFVSEAADPFQWADELPPSPSLGELWNQPPPPEPGIDDPFSGLPRMDAKRHWQLLTEEGIFGAPATGSDGDTEAPDTAVATGTAEAAAPAPKVEASTDAWPPFVDDRSPRDAEKKLQPDVAETDSDEGARQTTDVAAAAAAMGAAAMGAAAMGAAATLDSRDDEEAPEAETPESEPIAATPAEARPLEAEPAEAPVDTVEPTPAPTAAQPGEEAATATLGELYLKQGHRQEAERIFRQVLERDPGNSRALAGLDRLAGGEAKPAMKWLTAADLLAIKTTSGRIPEGLTAKKVLVLGNYVKHLRAAQRDRDHRHHVQ